MRREMLLVLAAVVMLSSPSGPGAAEPHLAPAKGGALIMSWLEPASGKTHALKFATFRNGRWSEPRTIVARGDFFVNWADFPSIVEDAKGTLFVHWLQKSGSGTYAYDVRVASSRDGGKTWSESRVLHTDGKQAEHGFVSMVPLAKGGVGVVWLDGREPEMQLRYAELDASLKTSGERVLDARVCECCTTAMAMTAKGPLVAYRDRSQDEVRDIGVMHVAAKTPKLVHGDGWKINGCPVNGPQLASSGNDVAIAWFAAPDNKPRVNVAFSRDGGATFGAPVRVDGGNNPIGRVEVLLLAGGSALVSWIEGDAILLRRVRPNGSMDAPQRLAATTSARSSGFPRAVRIGNSAFFAWTDATSGQIRLARVE
jgi:hypothetical protein